MLLISVMMIPGAALGAWEMKCLCQMTVWGQHAFAVTKINAMQHIPCYRGQWCLFCRHCMEWWKSGKRNKPWRMSQSALSGTFRMCSARTGSTRLSASHGWQWCQWTSYTCLGSSEPLVETDSEIGTCGRNPGLRIKNSGWNSKISHLSLCNPEHDSDHHCGFPLKWG